MTTQTKNPEYFSEYGQDKFLAEEVFSRTTGGVFVEAGALDGLLHSNTLYLERERGWRGVLVEASPVMLGRLWRNRPGAHIIGCALGASLGVAEFEVITGGLCGWAALTDHMDPRRTEAYSSRIAPNQRHKAVVQVRSLASVLWECGVGWVDYLSLDVEGAEYEVLKHYPFDSIPIKVIGVEDNYDDNIDVINLLLSKGYERIARVGVDNFWRKP